jgi:hypothetical protein
MLRAKPNFTTVSGIQSSTNMLASLYLLWQ